MLIETYLTVEDIERLRDQRLEQLNAQYRVTEQNIANLRERQTRLEGQIARFKPYSDKPERTAAARASRRGDGQHGERPARLRGIADHEPQGTGGR